MVFILNGECLPDSDPRARAARGQSNSNNNNRNRNNNNSNNTARSRFGSIHGGQQSNNQSSTNRSTNNTNGGGGVSDGPLKRVAKMIGVEGKFIETPQMGSWLPATRVPYIYLVVLGVLVMFWGVRALLVSVIVWYIYHHQQQTMPPPNQNTTARSTQ